MPRSTELIVCEHRYVNDESIPVVIQNPDKGILYLAKQKYQEYQI